VPERGQRRAGWPARVVVATTNRHKLREYGALLAGDGVELLAADAVVPGWSVLEDGDSFAANARIKARDLARRANLPALGDDSGLEVAALGGRPGVRSARYAGEHATDVENTARLLAELRDVPDDRRAAAFRCALALALPDGTVLEADGRCEGWIARAPRGDGGFGYDPVFIEPTSGRSFAQLSAESKNALSHRRRALDALRRVLRAQTRA
jgi:XTP/dITP diphosphohydrolase